MQNFIFYFYQIFLDAHYKILSMFSRIFFGDIMIKENQKYLNRLQIIIDISIIYISFALSYIVRFYFLDGFDSISVKDSLAHITLSLPVYFALYSITGLYESGRTQSVTKEISAIIKSNVAGVLFLILYLFLFKIVNFSRLVIFLFSLINTIFLVLERMTIRYTLRKYRRLGYNLKHCLIVGETDIADDLIRTVNKNAQWGYQIDGILTSKGGTVFKKIPVLGNFSALESILQKRSIDIVMITIEINELEYLSDILNICEQYGVKSNIIPYYYKIMPAKPYMDDLDGIPVIDTRHVPLDNVVKNFLKRAFDIVFSIFALIFTSPLLLFTAFMVKCSSPGKIIYKQERVGLNKKNFYMYKFRSMVEQNESDEKNKWTTANDPRKTKWGSFIRKTSIDELPQFVNVIKGEMSIVGPRPERPYFVKEFQKTIPKYMIKHQVRPGITGWAQVNGLRGDTSIEERIRYDLYYIENWTFLFDIKIIFLTVFKGFINKNAY